ncbi:MAG: hypothetical protein AAF726_25170 [Planctomycetota bacterium]
MGLRIRAVRPPRAAALVLAAVLTPSASAQLLNRATWLGSEEEGFRRDYRQDAEYFIDRAGYVDLPPWWREDGAGGPLDPFASRVSIAAGSVSSDDLTLETTTQLALALGKGATFRAQHLSTENQTTRFQRFGIGLDVAVTDETALFAQLEGGGDKERADLSLGAEFFRTERSAHRLMLTLVDFSDGKTDVFEYASSAYGLMLSGFTGAADEVQFVYDVSAQLPFEERELATGTLFEMERAIGLAELRIPIGARDRWIVAFDGELTSKENRPLDRFDPEREDGDVTRARLRTEWWRRSENGYDTTLGFWLHHLDEDYVRPNDLRQSRRVRRREAILTGRMRVPLSDSWTLEPYLFTGYVDLEDATGGIDADLDFGSFQGKIGAPILFRFSDAAFLRLDLSFQLDEFAFGGGGMQLQASF